MAQISIIQKSDIIERQGVGERKGSRLTKLEENKNDYLLENQKNI